MVKYHYYCDICGADMPDGYAPQCHAPNVGAHGMTKCTDLCHECCQAFASLDVPSVLREAVKAKRCGDPEKEDEAKPMTFVGNGSAMKRTTYDRLTRYKNSAGLGAYIRLVEASSGKLTENDIRMIVDGVKVKPAQWKALSEALDAVEKEEENAG